MVIYSKQKRYDDEIRVTKKAIEIFTKENRSRFDRAYDNPENESIKAQLLLGFINCSPVMGTKGWYVYSPYEVKKWEARLLRVIKRKEKNKQTTALL